VAMRREKPIAASEISVVVQGPLYGELTRRAVASVRRHLPGAEVIYSGWKGSDPGSLGADKCVLSEDPGARAHPHDPRFFNNTNRQIVSTIAGLREAAHEYAIKLRSDHLLTSARFLEYFDQFPNRGADYAIFEHRVIASDIYTKTPERGPHLFHPTDWFHFGLKRDLLLLWDLPLAPEPDATEYFKMHPEENALHFPELMRFGPEEYNWLECLRKRYAIPFRHIQDFSAEAVRIAELALVNNFIVLELKQIGLAAPRHPFLQGVISECYTHGEFLRLYRKHCDPTLAVSPDFTLWRRHLIRFGLRAREKLLGTPTGLRTPVVSVIRNR
jgi:hypothetical protein